MFRKPDFSDIHCILIICYPLLKIFGMAPYQKKYIRNQCRFMTKKIGFQNLTIVICNSSLIAWGMYQIVHEDREEPLIKKLLAYLFAALGTVGILSIIHFLFTQKYFLETFRRMNSVDRRLKLLGVKVSYHKEYFLIFALSFTLPLFSCISEMSMTFTRHRGVKRRVAELLCFGFSEVIRLSFFIHFSILLHVIKRSFRHVNQLLVDLGCKIDGDIFDYSKTHDVKAKCATLRGIVKAHEELCSACKCLTNWSQVPLFINITFNVVFSVFEIYGSLRNDGTVTVMEMVAYGIIFWIQLIFVITLAVEVEFQAKYACRLMGFFTESYFNENLSAIRNTFLLQTLHNNVHFNVCGCYDLNLSIVSNHMDQCNSLVIFLLKMPK